MVPEGRRPARRLRVLLPLVTVVAAGCLTSSASHAHSPAGDRTVRSVARQASLPTIDTALRSPVGVSSTARATKAKVSVSIKSAYAAAYLNPTYRTGDAVRPAPKYYLPKVRVPNCNYNQTVINADIYPIDLKPGPNGRRGTLRSVGYYPPSKARILAFGIVPVTATLRASQMINGKLRPLKITTIGTSYATDDAGVECDQEWSINSSPPPTTFGAGDLDIAVSDVKADGRPIDVGPRCHTASPVHVNLFGQPPTYTNPQFGGILVDRADDSTVTTADGNVYPLYPGSSNLVIPPFTGCVSRRGDDVSRLLTSLVSGPGNSLSVAQSFAATGADFSDGKLDVCPAEGSDDGQCATLPAPPPPIAPGR